MEDDIHKETNVLVKSFIEAKRPPVEHRSLIDLGFSFDNNTFELFQIRPKWSSKDSSDYQKIPFAKISYSKTDSVWKLYWVRATEKWELYKPFAEASDIEEILLAIHEDINGCFFG